MKSSFPARLVSGNHGAGTVVEYDFRSEGTSAGILTAVSPCFVSNYSAGNVLVKVNPSAVASLTSFDTIVPANQTIDVSREGLLAVKTLSIHCVADCTTGKLTVTGIPIA